MLGLRKLSVGIIVFDLGFWLLFVSDNRGYKVYSLN